MRDTQKFYLIVVILTDEIAREFASWAVNFFARPVGTDSPEYIFRRLKNIIAASRK